ncbi:polysaccharide deacetylase family protein [Nitrospira sp. Nam80]
MRTGFPDVERRVASLSLDLDDKWAYLKTNGDPSWRSFPSYLELLVPRTLKFLVSQGVKITFFIVGQDAALDKNRMLLRAIADDGHEIGHHSFFHDPWLHLYSQHETTAEIAKGEEHIERATGQRPVGFRGPGYSLSRATVSELTRRGYLYDATTFPTFLMPVVRQVYFAAAKFSSEEKRQRKWLGGRLRDGLRPNKPYYWNMDGRKLLEIPVTTLPGFKLPMHMSYLLALNQVSRKLALGYLDLGLRLCRLTGVEPSMVLHPTDFLGLEDGQGLSITPGMVLPLESKLEFVSDVFHKLLTTFSVVTLRRHASIAGQRPGLPVINPLF